MIKNFVDIDQTVCFTPEVNGKMVYYASEPIKENIEKINRLYDKGEWITYWTARGSASGNDWEVLTRKQLKKWGCKFHELRMGKPSFDRLIDDKAINIQEL